MDTGQGFPVAFKFTAWIWRFPRVRAESLLPRKDCAVTFISSSPVHFRLVGCDI